MPGNLQHILEPGRRHQRAAGKLAFQHRIGGDRSAVQQQTDLAQRKAEAPGCLPHSPQ